MTATRRTVRIGTRASLLARTQSRAWSPTR